MRISAELMRISAESVRISTDIVEFARIGPGDSKRRKRQGKMCEASCETVGPAMQEVPTQPDGEEAGNPICLFSSVVHGNDEAGVYRCENRGGNHGGVRWHYSRGLEGRQSSSVARRSTAETLYDLSSEEFVVPPIKDRRLSSLAIRWLF